MLAEATIIRRALALLHKRNLVLSIHDPSFPGAPGEDIGRGSPYTRGGREFIEFIAGLGFTGLQFGPQGQTSPDNKSPYDGTIFARNLLSVDLLALAHDPRWAGILPPESATRLTAIAPADGRRVAHRQVHTAMMDALDEAYAGFVARRAALDVLAPPLRAATERLISDFAAFRTEHHGWLERDTLFTTLAELHGTDDWRLWPPQDSRLYCPAPEEAAAEDRRRARLLVTHAPALERHAFQQFIAHAQHDDLRLLTERLGLKLFGDLQIGLSDQDRWSYRALFLPGYHMGAPPSRTNPDGQPWNYPVLDPAQYYNPDRTPGPVLAFMSARVLKMLREFDGLRIDHPHGHVCPWVYRAHTLDSLRSVQSGARLFSSPDLPDHPALARHAIVRPDQIDHTRPRHADDWVRYLDDDQIHAYSALFDTMIAAAEAHGRDISDLLCEVLSTQPYQLRRVLERHGLGRFRVTQKADLQNPADVYRSENAAPADWIMVGNHDTASIWQLIEKWRQSGGLPTQAHYLASRLAPAGADLETFEKALVADPTLLAHAKFADIFASPADNVLVFFADLLGYQEPYNVPGTVNDDNWSLRITPDYATAYAEHCRRRTALDLPTALAMALRRADQPPSPDLTEVLAALDALGQASTAP
jgi:4-alpha-glucanotransferase